MAVTPESRNHRSPIRSPFRLLAILLSATTLITTQASLPTMAEDSVQSPTDPEQMLERAATVRQFHSQLMDARAQLVALYRQQRMERHPSSHPFFEETSP